MGARAPLSSTLGCRVGARQRSGEACCASALGVVAAEEAGLRARGRLPDWYICGPGLPRGLAGVREGARAAQPADHHARAGMAPASDSCQRLCFVS